MNGLHRQESTYGSANRAHPQSVWSIPGFDSLLADAHVARLTIFHLYLCSSSHINTLMDILVSTFDDLV